MLINVPQTTRLMPLTVYYISQQLVTTMHGHYVKVLFSTILSSSSTEEWFHPYMYLLFRNSVPKTKRLSFIVQKSDHRRVVILISNSLYIVKHRLISIQFKYDVLIAPIISSDLSPLLYTANLQICIFHIRIRWKTATIWLLSG